MESKYKNKNDDELVSDSWNTINSRGATVEMMRRLKDSIEKFNSKSSDQAKKMVNLNRCIIALTLMMLIGLGVQVGIAIKQTNYTEMQSRSERIQQARSINSAIEFCEQNPESEESGLFEISSGKSVPCKQVLQTYKK